MHYLHTDATYLLICSPLKQLNSRGEEVKMAVGGGGGGGSTTLLPDVAALGVKCRSAWPRAKERAADLPMTDVTVPTLTRRHFLCFEILLHMGS